MNFFCNRILFIGAPPGDIELGCGVFLHQAAKQNDVLCVTLSDNQKNSALEHVRDEYIRSMAALGVPSGKVVFGPFTTRIFADSRQDILEYFFKL